MSIQIRFLGTLKPAQPSRNEEDYLEIDENDVLSDVLARTTIADLNYK